jgi:hypothetical protein
MVGPKYRFATTAARLAYVFDTNDIGSEATSWDGGAVVSDTCTGTAVATVQTNTATIAAADVPDSPKRVTIMLTPAAHTTDTMNLFGAKLIYYRK